MRTSRDSDMDETRDETTLVRAAQAGEQLAFEVLVKPYRRELLVHCYRMLGSVQDAEDIVQETMIRAWAKRATYSSPGSFRAWIYRIATNLCLNALNRLPRRVLLPGIQPASDPTRPLPPQQREPIWIEPFPDELLAGQESDPESLTIQREHTTLAFLVALQQLTPEQRAILLLREVLEWKASEVAEWLHLSVPAVNSALQRARDALRQFKYSPDTPAPAASPNVQSLLDRYLTCWEQADIPGLAALLREDAWFTMPPIPVWFQGRAAIATLFQTTIFTTAREWSLLPTRANGSPAFGLYHWETSTGAYQLFGLVVLGIVGDQIGSLVAFLDLASLSPFDLPANLISPQSTQED